MLRDNKTFYAFLTSLMLSLILCVFKDGPIIIAIIWVFFFAFYGYEFYKGTIKKEEEAKKHAEELKKTQAYKDYQEYLKTDEAKQMQSALNQVYGNYYLNKASQDFAKKQRKNWFW